VRPSFTTGLLGVEWQKNSGYIELNGLWRLAAAARGKYLFISDDSGLLAALLANTNQKSTLAPAVFVARFDHQREKENFGRLAGLLDKPTGGAGTGSAPDFFSENIGSLSLALAGVSSEKIVVRDLGDKVNQTVTYQLVR
jgi:hypothetical protein